MEKSPIASVTPSPVDDTEKYEDQSYSTKYTASKNKCQPKQQGICKRHFAKGTFKTAHKLTSECPEDIHELCMAELQGYSSDEYVAVVIKPDLEDDETDIEMWTRIQIEINIQMELYEKTAPNYLTPNIPAIVIVNDNTPRIIMKESFGTLNTIPIPNYVVMIMEKIQDADVNFDIDEFTTRLINAGVFWWDCKPGNVGYALKNGIKTQILIDCDEDFIYFLDKNEQEDEALKRACKIFMMLEYCSFAEIYPEDKKNILYTRLKSYLPELQNAINRILALEQKIIKLKKRTGNNAQNPINTLMFYFKYFHPNTKYISQIAPYFSRLKLGGYSKRTRTKRLRYRRHSKTKKATEGSLRSRTS
jgi:hypothetical protein